MDEDSIAEVIASIAEQYSKELQLAMRRQQRARENLDKATRDIDNISGAIMAVQDIVRRLNVPEPDSDSKKESRGAAPLLSVQTLSGNLTIQDSSPTPPHQP